MSFALSKRRIAPHALALVIFVAASAPRPALGNRLPYEPEVVVVSRANAPATPAEVAATAGAPEGEPAATDDTQQPKRKGNGFVRALGAPFRALARLFGGGKKSTTEQAKSRDVSPAQPAPADADAATPEAPKTVEAAKSDADSSAASSRPSQQQQAAAQSPAASSSSTSPMPVPTPAPLLAETKTPVAPGPTRVAEGARVVRPGEGEAAVEPPKVWIPVIEGISKDPLTQGRALLEHGYLQEAIAELSVAATQVGPELVEANNLLGLAYDRMGWHKQASEAYERALTVAPKEPVVLANYGYSLYLADDYAGALKRLKLAAKLAPGIPVIYNNLGIVQARVRNYGESYKYFALATNEYDAHLKLASILEDQKLDREAIKHYEAALRMQPGASAILERLAALYERTGDHNKAEAARQALGQPKNPQKTATGGGG
jgi:Tfp pilus assembly protein PilF